MSLYKSLKGIYWIVGAICIVILWVIGFRFPQYFWKSVAAVVFILIMTISILSKVAVLKFKEEVFFYLENCRVNEYLEKVSTLFSKKREKVALSANAYLMALGYDALGDYDAMYDCCLRITRRDHMSEYHTRMFDYYLYKENFGYAKDEIAALQAMYSKEKNDREKLLLKDHIDNCEHALRIHLGDYEGAEEYYLKKLDEFKDGAMLSRVSYSFGMGRLMFKKGEYERAKEYLKFAYENSGDTKYKEKAETILAQIG